MDLQEIMKSTNLSCWNERKFKGSAKLLRYVPIRRVDGKDVGREQTDVMLFLGIFEGTSKVAELDWTGTWLEGRRGPTETAKLGMINS